MGVMRLWVAVVVSFALAFVLTSHVKGAGLLLGPGVNNYLTPPIGIGQEFFGVDLGVSANRNREDRQYRRNIIVPNPVTIPYNTTYRFKESYPKWGIRAVSKTGLSSNSVVEFAGDLFASGNFSRSFEIHSDPATSGGGVTVTQDFQDTNSSASVLQADAGIAYILRLQRNAEAFIRYDYQKDYYRRDWDYQIIRNDPSNALRSVNRDDFFSLKDDQNCHDLRVGYRSLSWQALLGPYERYGNLDFIGKPFLFSGATFFEMSVGLRLVNNIYGRGFRNVDALFFGLGGLAPADSLFFQEEDYSNIPRTIRDRYTQGFLEAKSRTGGTDIMFGGEAVWYFPVKWGRDVDYSDGPHVLNYDPAPRTFSETEDRGKRHSWKVNLELVYRVNPYLEFSLSQAINGRRDGYESENRSNYMPAVFATGPSYEKLVQEIQEDVYETTLALRSLSVASGGPGPVPLDFLDKPFLLPGQTLLSPYFGYRRLNYRKNLTLQEIGNNNGFDFIKLNAILNQWFLGVNSGVGLPCNGMFTLDARWDIPASFNDHSPYYWNYGSGDFGLPSAGRSDGSSGKFTVDSSLYYRPSPNVQYGLTVEYVWIKNSFNWAWGPVVAAPPPTLLEFFDKYYLTREDREFKAFLGIRRFF